ncbi:hypothetical protein ACFL3P_03070 [Pseudomonadota bacterium]
MLNVITTIITSLSLGLFCLALNFYVDLHFGYEFVAIAISLQVASFFIAVAISRADIKLKDNALLLLALASLIVSSYCLFLVDFVSVPGYLVALLCVLVPVILLGLLVVHNAVVMSMKTMLLSVFLGFFMAIFIANTVFEREGLWLVFSLSAAVMTLSIILMTNIPVSTKILALCLLVGCFLIIGKNDSGNQLANWTLSGVPVKKPLLGMLYDPEQNYRSIDETSWGPTGRVDTISSRRSRNDGYVWAVHNASNSIPFPDKENVNILWWRKYYPLMILPFELKKPSNVLTVAVARGGDVDISQQLYGAETVSIYSDCAPLKSSTSCEESTLNEKLADLLNSKTNFDLVSFSMPYQVANPYVGVSATYETIHTIELFQELYDKLNNDGVLAVTARDQVMLNKTLSYAWQTMSESSEEKIINFKKNIRILQLGRNALHKDAYNYLMLLSKDGFATEQIGVINDFVRSAPITKVIYDSDNNIPPYIFFKQLDKIKVSDAVLHLTRASSWKYKKLINLEPSSIIKPGYFYLTGGLHPFVAALSAIFLFLGLYGLFFSHQAIRKGVDFKAQNSPILSVLLFQLLLSTAAFILVFYTVVDFASASLGYSSHDSSLLIVFALGAFAVPYVFKMATGIMSKGVSGLWFYLVALFLCVFILKGMSQDIEILLGLGAKSVIFILIVMVSFCSGLVHRQVASFIAKLYPVVWFWAWCMTSVGIVLGVIVAQYILIEFGLDSVVRTAMGIFLFTAVIAWWCLGSVQEEKETKNNSLKESF